MERVDELGSHDQELSDDEKKNKLLRKLPESYEPISMVCNVTTMNFNEVVNAMNAEIERQRNVHNLSSATPKTTQMQAQA